MPRGIYDRAKAKRMKNKRGPKKGMGSNVTGRMMLVKARGLETSMRTLLGNSAGEYARMMVSRLEEFYQEKAK